MNFNKRIKKLAVTSTILSIIIIITIIGIFTSYTLHNRFIKDSKKLKQEYYEEQEQIIKNRTYNVYDYIEYYKSLTEDKLKNEIQGRTNEAYNIAFNIYDNNKDKSIKEIEKLIKDALRNIRFQNGSGYFFATRLDGTEVLNALNPGMEGENVINVQDTNGKFVIKDMINISKTEGEGFYEYTWTKPNSENSSHRKISYIKYFEPLNIFIGTGLYFEDLEKIVQKELIDRISAIKFEDDGYIFITTYEGQALVFGKKDYNGKSIADIVDIKGENIHDSQMKEVHEMGEGYVDYYWNKPNSDEVSHKRTFVKGIDDWQWIIGTGVHIDEIENTITKKLNLTKKEKILSIAIILGIIIFIGCIDILFKFYILRRITNAIKEEDNLYETLIDLSEDAIFIVESDGKILKGNNKCLEILSCSKNELLKLNFMELIDDELFKRTLNNTSIESNITKGSINIPVEIYTKSIKVGKQFNHIIYVRDLTARKIYEDALKELVITDELTQIYNRRYITEKFNFEIERLRRTDQSLSIALIDIDNFKSINDTYGHTFGDDVLKTFAGVFKQNFRKIDYIGRYGGEEFLILLPNTDKYNAHMTVERAKNTINNIKWENKDIKLSFSAGIIEINKTNNNYDIKYYINKADNLLYKAKENGRDRIEIE